MSASVVAAHPGWRVAFVRFEKVEQIEAVAAWIQPNGGMAAWPLVRGKGPEDNYQLLPAQSTVDTNNYRIVLIPPHAEVKVGDPTPR